MQIKYDMPTVEFSTGDLMRLVGKRVPLKEFEERAAMMGTCVEAATDDKIIVEIFPNRPDMLSVEGFARAYRTFTGLESGSKGYKVEDLGIKLAVDDSAKLVRPYIVSAIVKNLPVTEDVLLSIIQMQEALHGSHGRRRAKVAIGIHDFDKTEPPYEYKAVPAKSISFVPLDFSKEMTLGDVLEKHPKGVDYKHILEGKKLLPVVLDRKGVVSLPPIINADRTRVTNQTSNLLIEMTGTNKPALKHALNIVLASLADRGGRIVSIQVGKEKLDMSPEKMRVGTAYLNKLLGLRLKAADLKKLFGKMGFGVSKSSEKEIEVLVPCYRTDILHPIDVVEDIAIAYGYENFKPEGTSIPTIGRPDVLEEQTFSLKLLMLGLGFQETASFTLTNEGTLAKAKVFAKPVRIKNPRTAEFTLVRPSAIPSLLDTLAYNKKKRIPQRIFEIDEVVAKLKDNANKRVLGMAVLDREVNFSQMQSVVEALLKNLGVSYKLKEVEDKTFIRGRCGEILINGKRAGVFGEVHPQVLTEFGLDYPAVIAEVDADALFE